MVNRATKEGQVETQDLSALISHANTILVSSQKEKKKLPGVQQTEATNKPTKNQVKPNVKTTQKTNVSKARTQKESVKEETDVVQVNHAQTKRDRQSQTIDLELFSNMTTLFAKQKYKELVEMFENHVLAKMKSGEKTTQLSTVPNSYLPLVTCSLLNMVA